MITWIDHALCVAFAVVWPVWAYRHQASYRASVRAGVPGARLAAYAESMITEWLFAAAAVALWIQESRDWNVIGLFGLDAGRIGLGLLVAAALGGFLLAQSALVARRPETHAQVRASVLPLVEILPAEKNDLTGFIAVSLTAGVCEELLFRGLLPWYFAEWMSPWSAQLLAVVVFGAAHFHLGLRAAVKAFLAGAVFAALYLWTGSLLPGMLLHAVVDIASGWMAYEVLRERAPLAQPAA